MTAGIIAPMVEAAVGRWSDREAQDLSDIADLAMVSCGASLAAVVLWSEGRVTFRTLAHADAGGSLADTPCALVMDRGGEVDIEDFARDPAVAHLYFAGAETALRSCVGVPVRVADVPAVGAVCAGDVSPRPWTPVQRQRLSASTPWPGRLLG